VIIKITYPLTSSALDAFVVTLATLTALDRELFPKVGESLNDGAEVRLNILEVLWI
jgi:hypothetical protein